MIDDLNDGAGEYIPNANAARATVVSDAPEAQEDEDDAEDDLSGKDMERERAAVSVESKRFNEPKSDVARTRRRARDVEAYEKLEKEGAERYRSEGGASAMRTKLDELEREIAAIRARTQSAVAFEAGEAHEADTADREPDENEEDRGHSRTPRPAWSVTNNVGSTSQSAVFTTPTPIARSASAPGTSARATTAMK